MALTREQVERVARSARIGVTEAELDAFTVELSRILDYMETISRVDTRDVPPTYHILPLDTVLRPDQPQESLPREQVLANAPDHEAGYFRVPKITEG